MEGITLIVALVASVAVFCLTPVQGLIIYIAALTWYPSWQSVKLGTIDFTASRIVILVIFINLAVRTNLIGRFKLIWLDKMVIIYFVCQVVAGATTTDLEILLENRAGAVFDMALPYFAARLILLRREHFLTLLKGILLIAVPIAVLGCFQSITSRDPVYFLREQTYEVSSRFGFYRAMVTFSHSIMLGLFFSMFGAVCAGLMRQKGNSKLYLAGLILMLLGACSSVSSGPILALLSAGFFIFLYRYRQHAQTMVIVVIVMCLVVEIISNRHFYDVLGDFTFNPATAWYRSRLIDAALFRGGMSGHWFTGYGFIDPGWGPLIDGRIYTDIVNHYLLVLKDFGLVGLIPFLIILALAIKRLVEGYKGSSRDADRWMVWCVAASLFGLLLAFTSVSLFGPPKNMFFMLLAFCGAMPVVVKRRKYPYASQKYANRSKGPSKLLRVRTE